LTLNSIGRKKENKIVPRHKKEKKGKKNNGARVK